MTTLYRFFDADGTLLYVGITDSPLGRHGQHAATQRWWHLVKTATFEHHPTRDLALAAETEAIKTEHPAFNAAGNDNPRRSERLAIWDARQERRAVAEMRALYGQLDYTVPPFDVGCRACLAAEFEPCLTPSGRQRENAHDCRPRDSREARQCPLCGSLPPMPGSVPGPPKGIAPSDRI
ncbi:GIY-YIG nuclease family protein [Nonomuraea angiospora]|uniref:GIY-YIG nuclease family protein n=1 Tax=Nonomuraea angiospora TaxID=46172 RepID=UPI0029A6F748|nr:GIY-YIG nuclease family protein [Nonomuraea angiospora]MDX3109558.1 GIY-YIG nuclease family protein [Nonomuraea angiospora]